MNDDAEKITRAANKGIWCTGCGFWVVLVIVGAGLFLGNYGPSAHLTPRSVQNPIYHPPTSTPVPPVHVSQQVGDVGYGVGLFFILVFGIVLVIALLSAVFK
jgi:hypothetical protein